MPRALSLRSRARIAQRRKEHPRHLSARLGAAMADLHVPAGAIAEHLEVSTDTIYRWTYTEDVPVKARAALRDLLVRIRTCVTAPLNGSAPERTAEFNRLLNKD
jgi:hypothetical protein